MRPFQRSTLSRRGFTLVETLISVFILAIGTLISLLFFVQAQVSTQLAQDMTEATTHADFVLEEIYGRERREDITTVDWTAWTGQEGLITLPEEKIAVSVEDQPGQPLKIKVEVTWQRKGRNHQVSLWTELTK